MKQGDIYVDDSRRYVIILPEVTGKETNTEYVVFKYFESNCKNIFAEELAKFKLNYKYCYNLYDNSTESVEG